MRILGPVFWYDLVRVARRQRLALWRAAYGLALLAALFLLYVDSLPHAWLGGRVKPDDAAAFAGRFFAVFAALQFAAVILITPALTANALAEERGHNTLVFLLTTHLTNREIVLGKLFTRLLQVGLLVLTGLPVLGLLQLMGGVEPRLVLASFAALALTGLTLGSLGLACALFTRKPQNAAWRAYQIILLYAALSLLSIWYWGLPAGSAPRATAAMMSLKQIGLSGFPPAPRFRIPVPVRTDTEQVVEWLSLPNPYYAYARLKYEQDTGATLEDALPGVLRDFALANGALTLLLLGLVVLRLRSVATRQGAGLAPKRAVLLKPAPHPPVRDRPVLWKEVYCEAKPRQRWLALFFTRWFFVASFLPAWVMFLLVLESSYHDLANWTILLLRFGGTLVACVLCLRVALHAARSIGQERDRQTLDSLLTTDLTPGEIVRDKWWGSLLVGRWVLVWLLIHWGLGVLALALHPLAVPWLVIECVVYAAFAASLGMYCAARFLTTKQATAAALVAVLFGTTLLPWAGGKFATAVLPEGLWATPRPRVVSYRWAEELPWPERVAAGLTPVRVLFESVFHNKDYFTSFYYRGPEERIHELLASILFGLVAYAVLATVLRQRAAARFRRTLGRTDPRQREARSEPVLVAGGAVAGNGWGPY
jgi:ABC-type transport system involved in multi-copper enzyme maturation permease subunit